VEAGVLDRAEPAVRVEERDRLPVDLDEAALSRPELLRAADGTEEGHAA
jgi:hypothetical protein